MDPHSKRPQGPDHRYLISLPLPSLLTLALFSAPMDSSDFTLPDSSNAGSRLLSEDLFAPSSSNQPVLADLSLSDLSLDDRTKQNIGGVPRRPFSLLAKPFQKKPLFRATQNESAIVDEEEEAGEGDEHEEEDEGLNQTMTQEDLEARKREVAKTREEKLQNDLFVLRKLNGAFDVYKQALRDTKSSTEVSPYFNASALTSPIF